MKTLKPLILSSCIALFLAIGTPAQANDKGPFETYLDCTEGCMEKYEAWTVRLTFCAADCYVDFVKSPLSWIISELKK